LIKAPYFKFIGKRSELITGSLLEESLRTIAVLKFGQESTIDSWIVDYPGRATTALHMVGGSRYGFFGWA